MDRLTAEESELEEDDQSSQGAGSAVVLDESRAPRGLADSVASPQLRRTPVGDMKPLREGESEFLAAKGRTENPRMSGYSEEVPPSIFVSPMTGEGSGGAGSGGATAGIGGTEGVMSMSPPKLDTPPRYNGNRRPGPRPWLAAMERYMRLTRIPQRDWFDVLAMRVDGAASAWVNATFQAVQ